VAEGELCIVLWFSILCLGWLVLWISKTFWDTFPFFFSPSKCLLVRIMQCSDPNLCPCHTVMRSELVFLLTQEIVS
jgi:hypothetical protein